jgi:hypothetical protein
MNSKNGMSLGNRLAAVANKHKKVSLRNSLKAMLNNARERGEIGSPMTSPIYQNMNPVNKKKHCGPKPTQWIGTKKNPAFENWQKCAAAAGGKRKTRRGKKSKRITRRRR